MFFSSHTHLTSFRKRKTRRSLSNPVTYGTSKASNSINRGKAVMISSHVNTELKNDVSRCSDAK